MPWYVEDKFVVVLGGNAFVNTPNLIFYRGASIFKIERNVDSGYLGISFKIFDETGTKLATIGQNRLFENKRYKGAKSIVLEGGVHDYTVIEKPSGRLICNIKQKEAAKPEELNVSVNLYMPDGFLLQANPGSINLPSALTLSNNAFHGLGCGIAISCPGEPQNVAGGVGMALTAPPEFCARAFSYE